MKRTPLRRKTPLKAKKGFKRPTATKKRSASKNKALEAWIKAIPENKSHGAGTYQKRLWRLVADYVKIRDFHKYGYCAATGKKFESWQGSAVHAGHLKPYSNCNALFKFDARNIHAQDGYSNKYGNYDDFRNFEAEVKRRGYDWDLFEYENNQAIGTPLRDKEVEIQMLVILGKIKELPEQPDYFERVKMLLERDRNYVI